MLMLSQDLMSSRLKVLCETGGTGSEAVSLGSSNHHVGFYGSQIVH